MNKISKDFDEVIAIVDDNDKVIGKKTFSEAHLKGLLHRTPYCYLINSKKQVLLQRRDDNRRWDHSSAGHISFNESYEEGIVREVEEELGIKLKKDDFCDIGKDKKNYHLIKLFLVRKDIPIGKFKIDKKEVNEIKYFSKDELNELILTEEITSSGKYILKKYIFPLI